MTDYHLDEQEQDLHNILVELFGETLDEQTAHLIHHISWHYLIGVYNDLETHQWGNISTQSLGTASNLMCHFYVIGHPQGWHNREYWLRYFLSVPRIGELPLEPEYECREALMLTLIANHPRVRIIADSLDELAVLHPDDYIR